jgi:protocatechuate 3,4-dioxygenase beta subunit
MVELQTFSEERMKLSLRDLFWALSILLLVAMGRSYAQSPKRESRPRTASIGGRVTISGAPAANALVTVVETSPQSRGALFSVESPQGEAFEVRTDSEGRYRVTGLAEGAYVIRALSKAYVFSKGPIGVEAFRPVTLDDGESRDGIDLALVRGGVITGRVIDAEGRPVIGAGLRLFYVDEKGRREREFDPHGQNYRWMLQTDDRGVYRIYGLIAGNYIVGAGGVAAPNLVRLKSRETFYPDTTDWVRAKIIEVKDGAEVADIDIRLGAGNDRYEAEGRVVDAETGKLLPRVSVVCMQAPDKNKGGTLYGIPATTDEEGRFTCAGLDPGPYDLSLRERMEVSTEYYSEKTRFEVTDSNVTDLEVKAIRGSTISGVVVAQGDGDTAVKAMLRRMSISVQVTSSVDQAFPGRTSAKIAGDGGFRLTGAPAGMARFELESGRVDGFLIKRVERDGAEIRSAFEIGRGEQLAGFRIVVAQAKGTIHGQVELAGVNLPEGCQLHIWATPVKAAAGSEGFYSGGSNGFVVADEKGRFVIERLSPGEYELRLTAMGRVSRNEWSGAPGMPEVTQRVTVGSGAETMVKLTLGPSRK